MKRKQLTWVVTVRGLGKDIVTCRAGKSSSVQRCVYKQTLTIFNCVTFVYNSTNEGYPRSSYGSRPRYPVDSSGMDPCSVSDFHPWGGCSVTCGQGFKRRFREFVYPDMARSHGCDTSVLVDTERCMGAFPSCMDAEEVRPGCEATDWTEWGPCNATCGKGIQIRTRRYVHPPPHTDCRVDLYDDQSCEGTECTPQGAQKLVWIFTFVWKGGHDNVFFFSVLELCTQPVDTIKCRGSYTKWHYDLLSQTCKKFSYGGCGGTQNIFDSKEDCEETCGSITELPSDSMAGYHHQQQSVNTYSNNYHANSHKQPSSSSRNRQLPQYLPQQTSPYSSSSSPSYQNYGSGYERSVSSSTRQFSSPSSPSYSNYEPPPVDCEVSEWTPWSKCSVSCGRGHKYRTRYIKVPPQNGGAACPHLEHKRKCKGVQCPPNHPFRYHHQQQQQQHQQHHNHHQFASASYDG